MTMKELNRLGQNQAMTDVELRNEYGLVVQVGVSDDVHDSGELIAEFTDLLRRHFDGCGGIIRTTRDERLT